MLEASLQTTSLRSTNMIKADLWPCLLLLLPQLKRLKPFGVIFMHTQNYVTKNTELPKLWHSSRPSLCLLVRILAIVSWLQRSGVCAHVSFSIPHSGQFLLSATCIFPALCCSLLCLFVGCVYWSALVCVIVSRCTLLYHVVHPFGEILYRFCCSMGNGLSTPRV